MSKFLESSRVLQLKLLIRDRLRQFQRKKILEDVMTATHSFLGWTARTRTFVGALTFRLKSCFVLLAIQTVYNLMIIANRELAVHLKLIRNLTGLTSGRFSFRVSITDTSRSPRTPATPLNIIEKEPLAGENRSELDEYFYTTRTFIIKSGMNVQLNQICIFKLSSPLTPQDQVNLDLTCQLIHVQQQRSRVVGQCKMNINSNAVHEYLQINFYDAAPLQLVGTVHSCLYKFQFMDGQKNMIDLMSYSQRSPSGIEEVTEYLGAEGNHNFQVLTAFFKELTGKEPEISCNFPQKIDKEEPELKDLTEPPIQKFISLKGLSKARSRKKLFSQEPAQVVNNETEKTEADEDHAESDPAMGQKRKRRKIFNTTSKELKLQKVQLNQQILHENTQKIYQIWRQIVSLILGQGGKLFFLKKCLQYQKKIKQKVGESVIRFKGSRDVDLYCNEEQMRAKLAYQLRNQDKQFLRDCRSNAFPVIDQSFFSKERPIFFEEIAESEVKIKENKPPKEILVIMVHGLGACRLDMEKIKVELRRYYDFKVKLYISSSNEARTEGDIDEMGQRLAHETDIELSKYPDIPKICFLGHSMGGVIIRSALPRLEKYKQHFHALITLSSPHLGYTYSNSALVDAGLWFINQMKKCTSIEQLTMQDNEDPRQTFLYKLSMEPGLEWFKRVVFLASHQDLYVPYYSARIQKSSQTLLDERKQVFKGQLYCRMIDNLLSSFKGEVIRLNVNFSIPEQNLDNLIGRAAHISFINSIEMVRTFVVAGPHYFF